MVDKITYNSGNETLQTDNTTTINWFQPKINSFDFPRRIIFTIANIEWYMELIILPGRFEDRIHMYLMQKINNEFVPLLDTNIVEGVQISINDKLRIYPYDLKPFFIDNYYQIGDGQIKGSYNILVSEIE